MPAQESGGAANRNVSDNKEFPTQTRQTADKALIKPQQATVQSKVCRDIVVRVQRKGVL